MVRGVFYFNQGGVVAKITKLYRYNTHHELETHDFGEDVTIDFINTVVKPERNEHGVLWRVRNGKTDVYGYKSKKEAKSEEIINLRQHIAELTVKLKRLEGSKNAET